MTNWNNSGNNYNLQPQALPFYPSASNQQGYVGFNDFLNQYQMFSSDQSYNNTFQYNADYAVNRGDVYLSSGPSQDQTNSYQGIVPNSHNPLVPFYHNNNVASSSTTYPPISGNPLGGISFNDFESRPLTSQYVDGSLASTSKLTATAREFIPQGMMNLTINNENPSKEPIAHKEKPSVSNISNSLNNSSAGNKKTSELSKSYNNQKGRSFIKNKHDYTNWRTKNEAIEPSTSRKTESETGDSSAQSLTIYNSNRNYADGNASNSRYNRINVVPRENDNAASKNNNMSNRNKEHQSPRPGYGESRSYIYNSNHDSSRSRDHYKNRDRKNEMNSEIENSPRDSADDRYNRPSYHNYHYNELGSERSRNNYSSTSAKLKNSHQFYESTKARNYDSWEENRNDGPKNYRRNRNEEGDKKHHEKSPQKDNANIGQRERLIEQLNRGNLECLVCCERIRQQDPVWSCGSCYHVLHLSCIKKWANSSLQDGLWRCPACQNQLSEIPSVYRCFCEAQRNPEWRRGGTDTAHSCGEICNKTKSCPLHPCTLPCHPGPCLTCESMVQKKCECGATQQYLKCSHKIPLLCGNICNRPLECEIHNCQEKCHQDACPPCKELVQQKCYCPKQSERTVKCELSTVGVTGFSCGDGCGRMRTCGFHECPELCHPGPCPQCSLSPELMTHCPCGQTRLEVQRKSCMDPIPTCNKTCCRPSGCGPSDGLHTCPAPCHAASCPPCQLQTPVSCRCGHITKQVPCLQLQEVKDTIKCGRKCTKKQSCGRHKCKETCCIDTEHRCPLPCTRTLSCGLHRCEDTCHKGHCLPCWRVSFEELRCRCGASVRYPPVECGARPPSCSQPCTVPRPCGHPPHHSCHPAHTPCPPCTVLTQRYCHGKHKLRKTIPCHQEDYSCGLPCGKDMPCGKHKCIESCHKGDCPSVCTQICNTERHGCGHACGAKCGHQVPCPSTSPCKVLVLAKCPCGRRSEERPCHEQVAAQRKLQVLIGPLGEPIDIGELIKQGDNNVTLECDSECQMEDRNRRLAIGLQIRNPDLSSKLAPKYSDFLRQMCARDENFASRVYEQLRQLVVLAKESKQRTRSHSFQPMSRPKRQFIHELCQHFGCESASYDSEPYRNIVATAYRERSWLPAMSPIEVIRREKGQRKVPPPILNSSSASGGSAWATLSSSTSTNVPSSSNTTNSETEPPRKPRIDYFDMPPED